MAKRLVTNKQKLILLLLYCFRFLNSKQIQEFLRHKDHRRINSWLKELEEKGFIVREFKPIYGILTKPTVCYLTALGRKQIRESYTHHLTFYLKRISRDKKASKAFQIRCQIIADWYLTFCSPVSVKQEDKKEETGIAIINDILYQLKTADINEETRKIPINQLQFFTPAYFCPFKLLEAVKPDAYVRKRTVKGVKHGFLFVLDAYIPRFLLRYSIKHIFEILDEEYWEDDETIQSLSFQFLCPNNTIIVYAKRMLPTLMESYYGNKTLNFCFATRNQLYIQKKGQTEKIKWLIISSDDDL